MVSLEGAGGISCAWVMWAGLVPKPEALQQLGSVWGFPFAGEFPSQVQCNAPPQPPEWSCHLLILFPTCLHRKNQRSVPFQQVPLGLPLGVQEPEVATSRSCALLQASCKWLFWDLPFGTSLRPWSITLVPKPGRVSKHFPAAQASSKTCWSQALLRVLWFAACRGEKVLLEAVWVWWQCSPSCLCMAQVVLILLLKTALRPSCETAVVC